MADEINNAPYLFKNAIRYICSRSQHFNDLSVEEWEWLWDDQKREEKEDKEIFQEICDVIKELSELPENKAIDIYDSLLSKISSYNQRLHPLKI